jgi:hypothetical protein
MPSPFPGMDPYLESPEIFPDFHDSAITYLREAFRLPISQRSGGASGLRSLGGQSALTFKYSASESR